MDKSIKEFKDVLKSRELKLLSLTRTGKSHYKAILENPQGKRMVYILSNSPSDHRSRHNVEATIKRFANN